MAFVRAEATLEVVQAPVVAELHFWALQVSFLEPRGHRGGAHLGLQWYPPHPGGTAVNFGGYRSSGGEIDGTTSSLASATSNPNTRDFDWRPGRPYRLSVGPATAPGAWVGAVDGANVRQLDAGGDRLDDLMVWSEVFARCDHPTVVVRWSDLVAVAADGSRHRPDRVTVTYQSVQDGGCANTDVQQDGDGLLQVTNQARRVPNGTVLPFG